MPKYVIERRIPGAGNMSQDQLRDIAAKSNGVLREMRQESKEIQWLYSYVSRDAIHCVYIAANDALIREHAACGGFPADAIHQVVETIDPTTAERGG